MKLSKRLETVASFVTQGSNIADIGTDHGYVPIFLVKEHIAEHVLAMDVRKGPLERATAHIESFGLSEKIETRLSDGLSAMKQGEADTVIIAGMGGELIIHIIENGRFLWDSIRHWILSPQSDLDKVRKYLEKSGFAIADESMLVQDGKYYTVMSVIPGGMSAQSSVQCLYGKALIEKKDPVLKTYLEKEKNIKEALLVRIGQNDTTGAKERLMILKQELCWIKEALDEMQ